MTSSNRNFFRVSGPLCHRWIPPQKPVTQSFDFFYLRLNKRLSKHSRRRWFETPSRSLWRHCNVNLQPCGQHVSFTILCVRYCVSLLFSEFSFNFELITDTSANCVMLLTSLILIIWGELVAGMSRFLMICWYHIWLHYIDGLVQERRNSSALAMELRLSCINLSIGACRWFGLKN